MVKSMGSWAGVLVLNLAWPFSKYVTMGQLLVSCVSQFSHLSCETLLNIHLLPIISPYPVLLSFIALILTWPMWVTLFVHSLTPFTGIEAPRVLKLCVFHPVHLIMCGAKEVNLRKLTEEWRKELANGKCRKKFNAWKYQLSVMPLEGWPN